MTSLLYLLLGAALVAAGALLPAVADRIRGNRATRADRPNAVVETGAIEASAIGLGGIAAGGVSPRKASVLPTPRRRAAPEPSRGDEVIDALVATGYKKSVAAEAVWSVGDDDRATLERWTLAALRRCARGAAS